MTPQLTTERGNNSKLPHIILTELFTLLGGLGKRSRAGRQMTKFAEESLGKTNPHPKLLALIRCNLGHDRVVFTSSTPLGAVLTGNDLRGHIVL